MKNLSWKLGKIFLALLVELGLVSSWCLSARSLSISHPDLTVEVNSPLLLARSYSIGDLVEIFWQDQWYPAKVEAMQGGNYCITYIDYDRSWDECVEGDRIRYPAQPFGNIAPALAEKVDVLWQGQWYPAIVYDFRGENYCITYVGYDRSWDECVESDRLRSHSRQQDRSKNPLLIEAERALEESYSLISYGQRYQDGLESAQTALEIYREINNPSGEARALSAIGWAYYWMNDYARSLDYYQQSLALAEEIGDTGTATTQFYYIGNAYMYLGDYNNSIEYQQKYLQRGQESDDLFIQAQALYSIGDTYYFQKNYPQALKHYEKSIELGGSPFYIGGVYTALGMHDEAIAFFEASAANPPDLYTKAVAVGQLGLNHSALGNYDRAIAYFQQQLAIARETEQIYSEWEAFKGLGSTFFSVGNLEEAEKNFRAAIAAQESIREKVGDRDRLKVLLFDTQTDAYQNLQKVLIASNKPEAALEIAERGRARAFVELLFDRISPQGKRI